LLILSDSAGSSVCRIHLNPAAGWV
jgi:hypothetical protein